MTTGWASIVDPLDMSSIASCWTATDNLDHETGSFPQPQLPCGEPGYGDDVWNTGRYYPTCTLLEDGRVLVTAGDYWTDCIQNGCLTPDVGDEYSNQPIWAIYDPLAAPGSRWTWDDLATSGGTFSNPWAAANGGDGRMFSYPHVRVLPYGLFYHGNDSSGEGTPGTKSHLWTPLASWAGSPIHLENQKLRNRVRSTCIILTLDAASDSVSVLLVGGAAYNSQNVGAFGSEVITYHKSPNSPTVTSTGWQSVGSMQSGTGRRDGNSVLLPDGKVLTIGGEGNTNVTQNRECEIFTPNPAASPMSGTWEQVAALSVDRGHHSVALLLPDGRVISSGHENGALQPLGTNYHVFYPPNLFQSDGTLAPRDTVDSAPSIVRYGLPFEITLKDDDAADIDEICLIAPCAVTHTTNFSQSRVLLSHSTVPGYPERLVVSGPKDSTYAQPGYFMLFALDDGVPSEAKWVKVERQNNSDYVIGSGETVRWGNDVWLDRDVEVEKGGTLEILPGTTVHVKANTDRANRGVSLGKVEIIHGGTTKAIGTELDPITFTTYDGSGAAGEWYGHRFMLQGCERASYGYTGAVNPPSVIEHASIENAEYGVKIEDFVAPSLKNVEFVNIASEREIYLDRTDVFVPKGYWQSGECNGTQWVETNEEWELPPGTNVVASNTCLQDGWVGVDGKTDLVVDGRIRAYGEPGQEVVFRPESVTTVTSPSAGRDWGGLYLGWTSGGSFLRYVNLGYATNPLFAFYPDSTIIRHAHIHHFAGTGLWVYGTWGDGAVIDSSLVERGQDLNEFLGETGVFLDKSHHLRFAHNRIEMKGAAGQPPKISSGKGLELYFGKNWCLGPPPGGPDTLLIERNVLLGPGHSVLESVARFTGLRAEWLCGASNRKIRVTENVLYDWNTVAFEFSQLSDIDIQCNMAYLNRRGIEVFRNSEPSGAAVRVKSNFIEIENVAGASVARTQNAQRLKLGPSTLTTGLSQLRTKGGRPFLYENEPGIHTDLNAEDNFWYIDGVRKTDPADIDNPTYVKTELTGPDDDPLVDVDPVRDDQVLTWCWDGLYENPGSGTTLALGEAPIIDESEQTVLLTTPNGTVPEQTALLGVRPNPTRSGIEVELAVGRLQGGRYDVALFDVTGRRVASLWNGSSDPGLQRMQWNGRDAQGSRVGAGIYFLRIVGSDFAATRKIVVIE